VIELILRAHAGLHEVRKYNRCGNERAAQQESRFDSAVGIGLI
jgi:hypothetical protein